MSSIFDGLPDGEPLRNGWWPAKHWGDVLACTVPQGSAILDSLCAIEASTRVLFVGLAGAVGSFTVGDVVEVAKSRLGGSAHHATWRSSRYPLAAAETVYCISESYERRDELVGHADVVDMESGWVLASARRHARASRAVVVVSDQLRGRSYLDSELSEIAASIATAAADAASDATRGSRAN